jgi:hypothetical protein
VALAARMMPAAECLETVRENLAPTTAQPSSAREQMLQAEAHLSFAQLLMAAAQKFRAYADERTAPLSSPSILVRAQLVRALAEAQGFEATASAQQASWTRKALHRTTCISDAAIEAIEVAAQTSWDPRECGTHHGLLDREERRLDEAFGGMMPDELPGAVVAVAEVWLDNAYENITIAQACLASRMQHEEKRVVTLEEHPEPPDEGTPAEKARRLWIPRAFQQTSYVSHMARKVCDDSTKADWAIRVYHEYRRLLGEEMMAVCRTYAEVKRDDLPVHEGREAQEWLTGAHGNVKRAREHIGMHIRRLAGAGEFGTPLQTPKRAYSHQQQVKRRARVMAYSRTRGAGTKPQEQAEEAAARARLQAARATGHRKDLSWQKEWTLGPRKREVASKETLPAHVHPAGPR